MTEPWVIVPVRGIASGKSRLAPALDGESRAAFNEWLLAHTLDAVREWRGGLDSCLVVSACERALAIAASLGAGTVREAGVSGLNAAALSGLREAAACGAGAVLVLPCDLPRLNAPALSALASDARRFDVTIAPDEAGAGTNALVVPTSRAFEFGFGEQSFEHHSRAARQRRLTLGVHRSAALAFDVDTPGDYARWRAADRERADAIVATAFHQHNT